MIIEFMVENFFSIKSKQTLTMAKSKSNELEKNSFIPQALSTIPLLKSTALYGANAAGKSNFILAMKTFKKIVENSAKETQRGDSLEVTPFLLSEATTNKPTEFEVIFIANGVKYQYGIALKQERITEEWLYAYPNGRPQRWFIRAFDSQKEEYVWDFSASFKGKKQLWKESTKFNSLFLSTAVMLNSEQLKPVFDWFHNTLQVTGIQGWDSSHTAMMCVEEDEKSKVLKFLKSVDLDISDIQLKSKTFDSSILPDGTPPEIREVLLKELDGEEFLKVLTVHKTESGREVLFGLDQESDGTRKIFSFAGPWIDALDGGKVLFIDELHDSLHPNIVKFLIQLFHSEKSNPHNAQLIFTTHETSILDQKTLRRDQVWFCKKEKNQSTTIYPLTDFSPRKDVENLEKSYLSGRYSALPLISKLDYIGE